MSEEDEEANKRTLLRLLSVGNEPLTYAAKKVLELCFVRRILKVGEAFAYSGINVDVDPLYVLVEDNRLKAKIFWDCLLDGFDKTMSSFKELLLPLLFT